MHSESTEVLDIVDASVASSGSGMANINLSGSYDVKCFDSEGNLKWEDTIKNLVVTVGQNDILDKYFSGSAYTAGWYMGLVSGNYSPTYSAADTLASHGNGTSTGWAELAGGGTAYSGTRPSVSWGSASAGSKVSTATSFSITASNTVAGAFLANVNSGTSGILYSAGSFTGGNRTVAASDTLNVTYTASTTAL